MWADGLIWTHCPITFDRNKTRNNRLFHLFFLCRPSATFVLHLISYPSLPRCPWLISPYFTFSSVIIKTQNVSQCFYCKCWTYSIMVMSIYCTQRLGASCLTALQFLPEWPHRMQLSEEMPEKFFHLPQKFGGKLHTWFFSEPQLVCNLGSSLRPLTPKDLDPSVPTRDPLDGSTQPSSYS